MLSSYLLVSSATLSFVAALPTAGRATHARSTGGTVTSSGVATYNYNNIRDGCGDGVDQYTTYTGDGSSFPAKSQWVSFENMFNNYKPTMFSSCQNFGQANDAGEEVGDIYNAIQQVSSETGVDHRFILAVIMQESSGCVRAPTTNYGVRNPGLMQDHNGYYSCNDGSVTNPCPQNTITGMVREGTAGTDDGDGLAQCINESGSNDVTAFYKAARIYNSGSIASSGNLEDGIATHCYASDIANRLTGWVNAPHGCYLDG